MVRSATRALYVVLSIPVILAAAAAQAPSLLIDIRPGAVGSQAFTLVPCPGGLLTSANDGVSGSEIWLLSGSPGVGSVLVDINPGPASSNPFLLTKVGTLVYFFATDGVNGSELWVTNGTPAGTHMVKDITPGPGSTAVNSMVAVGDTLYFTPLDPVAGYELWISDSTAAGTYLIKDINPGGPHSLPSNLTAYDGKVYFSANDGANGTELWTSDGTPGGTSMVKDINPGLPAGTPIGFAVYNGVLFFAANTATDGFELWSSNGTGAGTSLFLDIEPGASSSFPSGLRVSGPNLFFSALVAADGVEPWISDGSPGGTAMLKDINPGAGNSGALDFVALGGLTVFKASNFGTGVEPWVTDGTPSGTIQLADINSGSGSSFPSNFLEYNGRVYFTATDLISGSEPWSTDGTPGGTSQLADINPSAGSSPTSFVVTQGTLYFLAHAPTYGPEPWYLYAPLFAADTVAVSIRAGWNLASVPVGLGNFAKTSVFPTAITDAHAWESGAYASKDTLSIGPGYFIKFPSDTTIGLFGTVLTADSMNVDSGWNIVGPPSVTVDASTAIPSAGMTILSAFYGYDGAYTAASTLEPGKGYWVKVDQAGTITLDGSANTPTTRRGPGSGPESDDELSTIAITDASGRSATLRFGRMDAPTLGRFDLPPLPPAGGFDVRFASGGSAAAVPESGERTSPIVLTGAGYPVRLEWVGGIAGGTLVTGSGRVPISGRGGVTIESPDALLALVLRNDGVVAEGHALPREFALEANYPNPFNPSTKVGFDLPVRSDVRLTVYDVLGRPVATLAEGAREAGRWSETWDAAAAAGGVYFYRLEAAPLAEGWSPFTAIGRMALVK